MVENARIIDCRPLIIFRLGLKVLVCGGEAFVVILAQLDQIGLIDQLIFLHIQHLVGRLARSDLSHMCFERELQFVITVGCRVKNMFVVVGIHPVFVISKMLVHLCLVPVAIVVASELRPIV